jgi:hypothetical protein
VLSAGIYFYNGRFDLAPVVFSTSSNRKTRHWHCSSISEQAASKVFQIQRSNCII